MTSRKVFLIGAATAILIVAAFALRERASKTERSPAAVLAFQNGLHLVLVHAGFGRADRCLDASARYVDGALEGIELLS